MSAQTNTAGGPGAPNSLRSGVAASVGVGSGLGFDPIARAREQWVEQGWGQAADGMAAITSLMRAHQIVLARVEATLKPLGVTFARYEVLMLLWFSRRGSLPMKVIGSRLQVHPTSVTNALDGPRGPTGHARGADGDRARTGRAGHQGPQHRGVRTAGPRCRGRALAR